VKGTPQIIDILTLPVIVIDHFNHRKFLLIDPAHEFPWSAFFVNDFFNLVIEEELFRSLDFVFEVFSIVPTP